MHSNPQVKPSKSNSLRVLLFSGISLVIVLVFIGASYRPKSGDLLQSATKIVTLPNLGSDIRHTYWINSDQILLSRELKIETGEEEVIDVKSGKLLTFRKLQKDYRSEVTRLKSVPSTGGSFSPDGSKVLKYFHTTDQNPSEYREVFDLNGKSLNFERYPFGREIIFERWLPNSQGLVKWPFRLGINGEMLFNTGFFDGKPAVTRRYKPPSNSRDYGAVVDSKFRMIVIETPPSGNRTFNVVKIPLLNNDPVTKVTISAPDKGMERSVEVSPDGTKLLLAYYSSGFGSGSTPLMELLNWTKIDRRHYTSLWVCNLDGSNMKQVGMIPSSAVRDAVSLDWLAISCQWMPDSKHISFIDKQVLYSFPID